MSPLHLTMLFPEILPVSAQFSCWCLTSGPSSFLQFFLNSISYRRVICVYQYQVADDLSGRSNFQALLFFLTEPHIARVVWRYHFCLETLCWALSFALVLPTTNFHPVPQFKAQGCNQHCFQSVNCLFLISFSVWLRSGRWNILASIKPKTCTL